MNQTLLGNIKRRVRSQSIQHILVALDASPHSFRALEAAAELAQALGAELIGIFVEDVNLLKLAGLPFAQEIHYPKATTRKVDMPLMEKQLRQQADRAKEMMRQIAERDSLAWTFRVARGVVIAELLTAAMDVDLLVLGRTSRQLKSLPLGSTARTAVFQSKPPVLLLGSNFDLNQSLLVLYDGTSDSLTALVIAAELAQESGYLRVLITNDEVNLSSYKNDIVAHLRNYNLTVNLNHVAGSEEITRVIQKSDYGLFVLGNLRTPFNTGVLETVLEETDHPILVVR